VYFTINNVTEEIRKPPTTTLTGVFSTLLLNIGSGTVNDKDGYITIVEKLAVSTNLLEQLIPIVYQVIKNFKNLNSGWLCERVILTTTKTKLTQ